MLASLIAAGLTLALVAVLIIVIVLVYLALALCPIFSVGLVLCGLLLTMIVSAFLIIRDDVKSWLRFKKWRKKK